MPFWPFKGALSEAFWSTGPPEGGRVVGILLFIRSEAKKGRLFWIYLVGLP